MLSKSYSSLTEKQKDLFEYLKGLYVNYLYLTSDEPIDLSSLFSDLKEIKQLLHEIVHGKRKTSVSSSKSSSSNVAKGVKTRKNRSQSSIFRRKPKQRRFKNPIFLSLK
jgi:hypothetical protein